MNTFDIEVLVTDSGSVPASAEQLGITPSTASSFVTTGKTARGSAINSSLLSDNWFFILIMKRV
ncbi:MAG: hypothetical protein V7731_23095 [Amphritea sp.]